MLFQTEIGNSINPEQFNDFVENKLYQRQQKIIKQNCLSIETLPKFAKLFENSLMVSSRFIVNFNFSSAQKGKSNLMLNRSRRYQRKAAEEDKKNYKNELLSQIEDLKREVNLLQKDLDEVMVEKVEADKNADLLHRLFQSDIIDENGDLKQ